MSKLTKSAFTRVDDYADATTGRTNSAAGKNAMITITGLPAFQDRSRSPLLTLVVVLLGVCRRSTSHAVKTLTNIFCTFCTCTSVF